jgi:hypothetical protein
MIIIVSVVAVFTVIGGCVCYRNKQNSENEGGINSQQPSRKSSKTSSALHKIRHMKNK